MSIIDAVSIFLAKYLILFYALYVPYFLWRKKPHDLVRVLVAVVVAWSVASVIKSFFPVPRPFVVGGFEPLIPVSQSEFYDSFPSGHATFAFAAAVSALFTSRFAGILGLAVAILIGVGRVLVGVHYPLDIVAGALLGTLIAVIFKFIHDRFPVW